METNIIPSSNLHELARIEIDMQVATAKQYPRDIEKSIATIRMLTTRSPQIAEKCFYRLERAGRDGKNSIIEGCSVRFAEIVAQSWGNLRAQSRIVDNDGKKITAQAICHDLESNTAVQTEVQRRITTKEGRTFSEDMQVVTGNAAGAIAFRNAVLKVVPMALIQDIIDEAKSKTLSAIKENLEKCRTKMFSWYAAKGVTPRMIFDLLSIDKEEEITAEHIATLQGVANAISEGSTTIEETFGATLTAKKEKLQSPIDMP